MPERKITRFKSLNDLIRPNLQRTKWACPACGNTLKGPASGKAHDRRDAGIAKRKHALKVRFLLSFWVYILVFYVIFN